MGLTIFSQPMEKSTSKCKQSTGHAHGQNYIWNQTVSVCNGYFGMKINEIDKYWATTLKTNS